MTPEDRNDVEVADALTRLAHMPEWTIYVQACLDPTIEGLQSIILNGAGKLQPDLLVEACQIRAARLLLRTLEALRSRPDAIRTAADGIRAEMDTWALRPEEVTYAGR